MERYYIWCDESSTKGKRFSHFYGGILVNSADFENIKKQLEIKRNELFDQSELKWTKVNEFLVNKYIEFIDLLFDFVEQNKIKIRIMFVQNIHLPNTLDEYQRDNQYHLLYYQFLKHSFGFKYIENNKIDLEIFFDKLPDKADKNEKFKKYIYGIQFLPEFIDKNISISRDAISEVDSKKHLFMQSLDVVLGAMFFRLNELHKEINTETGKRGKRTIAKEKLYKHILERIKKCYKGFNIGISTGLNGKIENRWLHPYRHWKFEPNIEK